VIYIILCKTGRRRLAALCSEVLPRPPKIFSPLITFNEESIKLLSCANRRTLIYNVVGANRHYYIIYNLLFLGANRPHYIIKLLCRVRESPLIWYYYLLSYIGRVHRYCITLCAYALITTVNSHT